MGTRNALFGAGIVLMLALAGCAGGDDAAPEASESAATEEAAPEPTEGVQETEPGTAEGTELEVDMMGVPEGTLTGVTEFPVPAGAEIILTGGEEGALKFMVARATGDTVANFYESVLPDLGYTVTRDVTHIETGLEYELGFAGDVYGSVHVSGLGSVVVVLSDEPFAE